jgi:nitrogen regulatory protein P-II 1
MASKYARPQKQNPMKKIEAIIKPFKFDDVKHALDAAGFDSMTVSEVKGFGRQNVHGEVFRGSKYTVDSIPEIKIELMLPNNQLDAALAAIMKGSKTTKIGSSKIFVFTIEEAAPADADRMLEVALH